MVLTERKKPTLQNLVQFLEFNYSYNNEFASVKMLIGRLEIVVEVDIQNNKFHISVRHSWASQECSDTMDACRAYLDLVQLLEMIQPLRLIRNPRDQ